MGGRTGRSGNDGADPPPPSPRLLRAVAALALLVVVLAPAHDVWHSIVNPAYDPVRDHISEAMALGAPYRASATLFGLVLPGLATVGVAWALQRVLPRRARWPWGPRIIALGGVGLLLTALVPCAPGCRYPDPRTILHSAVASLAFASWVGVLLLVPRLRADPAWEDLATFHAVLGSAAPVVLLLYGLSTDPGPTTVLDPYTGLLERVGAYAALAWLGVVGWRLWRMAP